MLRGLFKRFRRERKGAATVEFVILLPAYLTVLIASYEAGIMMVRHAMLERGVDLAVRSLRLGTPQPPTFEEFKTSVCDNTMIIANCNEVVQVELRPVSTTAWNPLSAGANCIDVNSTIDPIDQTEFSVGVNNELMMVRVCGLYQPLFPTTTFGMEMPDVGSGHYALVVTSAFVNEPSQ